MSYRLVILYLADPGLLYKHRCHSFGKTVTGHPLPQVTLRSHGAFMVRVKASNQKIDFVPQVEGVLNLEGNPNCIIGSKVTVILLEG